MLSITGEFEVQPNGALLIQLPEGVRPGKHKIVLVIDEAASAKPVAESNAVALMSFAGRVQSFAGVSGLEYQRQAREEWN